jgi:hypothetical protein
MPAPITTLDFCNHGPPSFGNTAADIDRLCQQLLDDKPPVVGFDAEWAYDPRDRNGPPLYGISTIQLCYTSGSPPTTPNSNGSYKLSWRCLVLHVAMVPGRMTCKLQQVLENRNILLLTWGDKDQPHLRSCYKGLHLQLHDVMTHGWGKLAQMGFVNKLSNKQK